MLFGKTKIDNPIYYPLLASEDITGGVVSKEETEDIWSHFDLLSEQEKSIVTAEAMPKKIQELQEKIGCDDAAIEGISVLLRWFFFRQIVAEDLRPGLEQIVADKADMALSFIQKEIFTIKPEIKKETVSPEEKRQTAALVRMPLLQALSQYEQLGNQLITQERIKIKSQTEPVRPSLLYWIKYYRDELGVGHHNSMERGNFLFRSENGKRLSPEERERVNLVLKSVEENVPLEIDTLHNSIVFPPFVAPRPVAEPVNVPKPEKNFFEPSQEVMREQRSAPQERAGTLSFSSKHVLPAEKERVEAESSVSSQAPLPKTPPLAPKRPAAPANPFLIHPVSTREE
jgi:hypothetical protein